YGLLQSFWTAMPGMRRNVRHSVQNRMIFFCDQPVATSVLRDPVGQRQQIDYVPVSSEGDDGGFWHLLFASLALAMFAISLARCSGESVRFLRFIFRGARFRGVNPPLCSYSSRSLEKF